MLAVSVRVMELHSDGIVLRSWHPGDAARVFEVCQDPQIQHWLPTHPRPYTDADARAFVTDALGHGPYQLAVVEAGSVVGSVGLHLARHETGGIGYWCAREARRPGPHHAGGANALLLDELSLERLQLTTDVDNRASQRVAEKVGFQREGVIRSHLRHPNGQRRDSALFSLLPGELP